MYIHYFLYTNALLNVGYVVIHYLKIKKVPNFRYGKVHKRTKRLMARIINDKQYLVSPNFSVINEIGESF